MKTVKTMMKTVKTAMKTVKTAMKTADFHGNQQKYRDYLSRQVVFHFTFDVVLLKAQREMAKITDFDENCGF